MYSLFLEKDIENGFYTDFIKYTHMAEPLKEFNFRTYFSNVFTFSINCVIVASCLVL